jgi:hypothetical protein
VALSDHGAWHKTHILREPTGQAPVVHNSPRYPQYGEVGPPLGEVAAVLATVKDAARRFAVASGHP